MDGCCPSRYAPLPAWETWIGGSFNAMPGKSFNHLLRNENENYRPTSFLVCVVCSDALRRQRRSKASIEICATENSDFIDAGRIHFESQKCEDSLEANKYHDGTMYW